MSKGIFTPPFLNNCMKIVVGQFVSTIILFHSLLLGHDLLLNLYDSWQGNINWPGVFS